MLEPALHAAASVILLRQTEGGPHVLMGKRGATAAFMPSKFVFPGGRVDDCDHSSPLTHDLLGPNCHTALCAQTRPDCPAPHVLAAAALRELHEETGLSLAAPRAGALQFFFRAITPRRPNQPSARRFDARFFIADLADFTGDWQGFSAASAELSDLEWHSLPRARALDLPFITRVILAEVAQICTQGAMHHADGVPFFDNFSAEPAFTRL
jgi:8-oxo-dGTP pyrophosphatase MutT (NUDIX family)